MSLRLSSNSSTEISGSCNFTVVLSPQLTETGLLSSIKAEAFLASETALPISCKWFRMRNNISIPILEVTSNSYTVTCEDIGSYILVEVTALHEECSGTATGKIGPLRLDRSIRKALEFIISSGFASFPLSCTGELDYNNASDLMLEIDREQLRLRAYTKDGMQDTHNSFQCGYSVTYPKITLNCMDSQKLCFEMSDGTIEETEQEMAYNRKLMVSCLNQQTRDLILMSIRVLAIKNSIKIDRALEYYLDEIGKCKTEVYLELDGALQELYLVHENNQELLNINNGLKDEKIKNLQEIEEYKVKIENFEKKRADENERLKGKITKLNASKKKYKEKCEKAKKDMESINSSHQELVEKSKNESSKRTELESLEMKKLKESLEFALQDLEIAKAKDKTLNGKLKRQKEAIEALSKEKDDYKVKIEGFSQQEENYELLVAENKELIRKLSRTSESLKVKDEEMLDSKRKIQEMQERYEKTNQCLVDEISRLNTELENCENCEKLQKDVNKAKEEVVYYRNQCDSLSVQLGRMHAQARKSSLVR